MPNYSIESIEAKLALYGFRCAHCAAMRPKDWYWYSAEHYLTKKVTEPLCAECANGTNGHGEFLRDYKVEGPFKQPAPKV